uniref:Expansin-related protein 3 n=1 Tax=Rhizophora mucronata TaxID=61149 RepID=A0A2P2IKX0_RHIMU
MEMRALVLTVGCMVLCLAAVAHSEETLAIFYNIPPSHRSACYGSKDVGQLITGVSDALWNGGAACGRKYRVSCVKGANLAPHPCKPGTSVAVTVADYCRPLCNGTLSLSRQAFNQIADPNAGKVVVDYQQI